MKNKQVAGKRFCRLIETACPFLKWQLCGFDRAEIQNEKRSAMCIKRWPDGVFIGGNRG